jgi:hypothetical protein
MVKSPESSQVLFAMGAHLEQHTNSLNALCRYAARAPRPVLQYRYRRVVEVILLRGLLLDPNDCPMARNNRTRPERGR